MWYRSLFFKQSKYLFENNENLIFDASKNQIGQVEKQELPLKFVVSVSLILGGAFVMFAIPVPVLGYTGEMMKGYRFWNVA